MRIIGGKYGGLRISPPAQMPHTRPTTDIAREGLFNVLQNSCPLEGAKTLELFGGTGCISYELASRGATELTLIEKDPKQVAFIQKTAEKIGIMELQVLRTEVFSFLGRCTDQFDLIFAGPPYQMKNLDHLPGIIFSQQLLKPGGWFVLEHTALHQFESYPYFSQKRKYGSTIFSIFIFQQPNENHVPNMPLPGDL